MLETLKGFIKSISIFQRGVLQLAPGGAGRTALGSGGVKRSASRRFKSQGRRVESVALDLITPLVDLAMGQHFPHPRRKLAPNKKAIFNVLQCIAPANVCCHPP